MTHIFYEYNDYIFLLINSLGSVISFWEKFYNLLILFINIVYLFIYLFIYLNFKFCLNY